MGQTEPAYPRTAPFTLANSPRNPIYLPKIEINSQILVAYFEPAMENDSHPAQGHMPVMGGGSYTMVVFSNDSIFAHDRKVIWVTDGRRKMNGVADG